MHIIPRYDDKAYQHACSKTFPGSEYLNIFDLSAKQFKIVKDEIHMIDHNHKHE